MVSTSQNPIIMKIFYSLLVLIMATGLYGQPEEESNLTYAYRAEGKIVATEAPRLEGTYYRVELLKTPHFDRSDPALETVKEYGALRTEYLIDQEITRLLLGDFYDLDKARQCLQRVRSFGLNEAIIIRYVEGFRQGSVLDLKS